MSQNFPSCLYLINSFLLIFCTPVPLPHIPYRYYFKKTMMMPKLAIFLCPNLDISENWTTTLFVFQFKFMAMNCILGALNEAIRCREEKDEDLLSEADNSPSKKSAQGHSPSKLAGKGIRWAPPFMCLALVYQPGFLHYNIGAQKTREFQGPTPSNFPKYRNVYLRLQNIMHRGV
jgi:hypothetical protein